MNPNPNVDQYSRDIKPTNISPFIDYGVFVTPNDNVDTPFLFKVLTCTNPGNISWLNLKGELQSYYIGIPGYQYFIRGKRIMATGTTAVGISIGTAL